MNNIKNNKKGFALTQIVLAIALSSAVAIGVVEHYTSINHQKELTQDVAQIYNLANITSLTNQKSSYVGQTFQSATAQNGTVSVTADAKTCIQLQAKLEALGGVATCDGGNLTYQRSNLNTLTASVQSQPALSAGTPDSTIQSTPKAVSMTGTVAVAKDVAASQIHTPSSLGATYSNPSQGSASLGGSVSGGSTGTVTSSGVLTPDQAPPVPATATGTATTTPSSPVPTAPTVLFSMWSANVVISQINSATDHIDIGITCGVNPPQSQFDKTVQSIPASATTNGVNTTTETYFIPTGVPYTVIGGFTASVATTAISNMTAALPESLCEMGGGYGGVWAVNVQARTCNADNQCSAWSAPVAQFCEFNRC